MASWEEILAKKVANKVDVWMPLYIGDYLASTSRLKTEQHGAYLLLIMDYWKNGPPPDDDAVLAQICRMSPDAWSNARSTVRAFFEQCDGRLIHKRIDAELAEAIDGKAKATAKAQAAAAKRWAKDAPSNASSSQQALPESCPSPSPSPICNSEANASGGEPPKITDPNEIIFGYGVPLLTNAGTSEKQARSFLGGLRKAHGDQALIDKLRECLREKPLQPLEWLAAALPPVGTTPARKRPAPENFSSRDYGAGGRL